MGIAEIKANLIDHIGKIDLAKLSITELRDYCGLVKDVEGLTDSKTDMVKNLMDGCLSGLCLGHSRPAPTKEG